MARRANYSLVYAGARLGPTEGTLDVDRTEYVGDATPAYSFEVPTDDPVDAYLGVQAYDVKAFGHEILVNDEPLSGFDIPPAEGWQYWMDSLADATLEAGTNTVAVHRDTETLDSFAVGNLAVHWREPV
jgi:hypothetical protein